MMLKVRGIVQNLTVNSLFSRIANATLQNLCTDTVKHTELKCWKCLKNLSGKNLFCQYCSSVQKPDSQSNYYDLFDLKLTYLINNVDLSKKFKQLQSQLHPDKFSNKNQEEQAISETYSSYLNKAYSILQNPLERGLYLLSLQNISIEEDTKGTDQKLLMEILMLNEELDEASSEEDLEKLQTMIQATIDDLTKNVNASFEQKDFNQAKDLLIRMKYFTTLDRKVRDKKNQLELDKHSKYHPRSSECKAPWFDSLQIWYITSWTRKIKNDHPVEDVREQTVQDDFMLHSPCSSATHPLSDK